MGKDTDGPCCESCRQFSGENPVLPEPPPPVPIAASYAQVRIVVRERGGEPFEITPTRPEVCVGRVKGNDVVLPRGSISKRQCRFVFKDDRVFVQDMKSGCGTYLDGRKVDVGEVRAGSVISIGDFELRITSKRDR
jgi:hypothetical protein